MKMTDEEILASWGKALDKKKHVQILADRCGVGVWDMMLKLDELKAPELDRRWYQNLNPARKQTEKKTPLDERVAYMKGLLAKQDEVLKAKTAEAEELKARLEDLRHKAEEDAVDFKSQIKTLTVKLADAEEICRRQGEEIDRLQREQAAPKPSPASEAQPGSRFDVIRWFCGELKGGAAYLMGRSVELLLDWKDTGDTSRLRKFIDDLSE